MEQRFDAEKVKELCTEILTAQGIENPQAQVMSNVLVEADLYGVATHGISRLTYYLGHMENGNINAKPNISVVNDNSTSALTVLDADKAMGPIAADYAMKVAMDNAKVSGVGLSLVKNSTHMGMLSIPARKATKEKFIAIIMSNTSPIMAPWGGGEAAIGNNPISIAVPSKEGTPYVFDIALSITARGNIILADREGREIPEGWAVNEKGEPTTNAKEALLGAVLPMAKHKGYGLAFMIDVLCGVLSGASYGKNVGSFVPPDYSKPLDMGHFFLALDVEQVMSFHQYAYRLEQYVHMIKSCKKAKGFDEIFVPGEIENPVYRKNSTSGIKLADPTIKELRDLASKFNTKTKI